MNAYEQMKELLELTERDTWNEAIEAAAKLLQDDKWHSLPDKLRKLKK